MHTIGTKLITPTTGGAPRVASYGVFIEINISCLTHSLAGRINAGQGVGIAPLASIWVRILKQTFEVVNWQ
jgi:hypothetical protein